MGAHGKRQHELCWERAAKNTEMQESGAGKATQCSREQGKQGVNKAGEEKAPGKASGTASRIALLRTGVGATDGSGVSP